MKADDLRRLATHWIEEGWCQGNASIVDQLHAPGFVDHDPGGRSPDRAGFKEGIERLYASFPDLEARLEDVVIDEGRGKVAVRWSATGTHAAAYLGLPPTGKRIRFKGIEIIIVEGGLVTERWGEWDGLDLLEQMGGAWHPRD
jgi:steroid delta-isomerase-like uncharacterized protein